MNMFDLKNGARPEMAAGNSSTKIKILFVIPDLYRGGAQRVLLNLVRFFNRSNFEISLAVLIPSQDKHFTANLPEDIRFIQYNFTATRQAFLPLLRLIRQEKYQVVFSTLTHLNLLMAFIRLLISKKVIFVARESNTLSASLRDEKFPRLFRFLIRVVYRHFNLIICQSRAMADDLILNFKIPQTSIRVIYNPLDIEFIQHSIQSNVFSENTKKDKTELLCVGRLYPQKGYDRLLKILTYLKDFPYRLRIIGAGILEEELRALAASLGVQGSVKFLGSQENPFMYMKEADCLLLPSYYEGLPNVVLEANVCGLPVIAFNSPGVTSEIIVDGVNGWLIEDGNLQAFASMIISKPYKKIERQKIMDFAIQKFSLKKITSQYEDAIFFLLNHEQW